MEPKPLKKIIVVAALAISLFFLLLGSNYGLNIYDEGISLTGAMRVAHGQVPYKDFWTMYPLGEFYLLAGFMSFAGWSVMAERVLSAFIVLGSALAAYGVSKIISNGRRALITILLLIAFTGSYQFFGRAVATGLLLSGLSIFFISGFFRDRSSSRLVLSGIFCALTFLFRLDLGAYLLMAESFGLFVLLTGKKEPDSGAGISRKKLSARLLLYYSAVAVVLVPAVYFLASIVTFDRLWNSLVYTPGKIFPKYRSLPLPVSFLINGKGTATASTYIRLAWESIVFFIPATVCLASAWLTFKMRARLSSQVILTVCVLVAAGLLFHAQALVRSDIEHLVPAYFISAILFAFLFSIENKKRYWRLVLAFAVLFVISLPLARKMDSIKKTFTIDGNYIFHEGRAKGIILPLEWGQAYDRQIKYIRSHTSENEEIFVGNKDNDRIVINDAILYFLAGRQPGSYYHELHPGIVNDLGNGRNPIEDELVKNSVRYVILYDQGNVYEPNKSSSTTDSNHLDDFIRKNYTLEKQFGSYSIMRRTDAGLLTR